ncbi:MFS transporter [Spirosoma fluviale]|uniref:MFS transporter, DHA1 family, tetracycline resistance protein n=1 Tax=Spirosoma fluviale TaxID=1597977 RepID=A0A286G2G4_9BACT|nr:MFS transporter [Spirosoma fluviale]SOD89369.1 MFS transporter, DHA1 family, tetracycline resistance protein [Spirosoma fluviale]
MANRQLLHIYAIIFIDVIVGSAVGPILPEFVKGLERPQLWLAVGTALFLGMQLFSAPLLGKLSDGYGRRPIFIISAIGTFLADCLLLPVRVGYYFANRVSDGTTNGMYATVRSAITDISPKESLFKNLGIEGAIISLGFVIGPAVSGLLLTTFDVVQGDQARVVAIMAVTLSSVNMILSWTLRETHPNPPGITTAALKTELANSLDVHTLWTRLLAKDRHYKGLKILVLMQLALTFSTGYYFYFVTFASFGALQMDAKAISYFFMYFGGLSVVISYVFYGYIADRINQRRGIFWLALLGAPILGGYGLVGTSVLWLYILVTIDCLTFSLIQGLIEGLMAQLTSDEDRGEIFGINQALQGVASFVTTVVFGILSLIDLRLPFAWFGVCLSVVAWLAWKRKV